MTPAGAQEAGADAPAAWPARLGGMLDAMLHAVWLVDAGTLCILHANAAAGALLGCPAEALEGTPVADLAATPEDLCFWGEVAAEAAGTESTTHEIESDTFVRRIDGSVAPVTRRVRRTAGPDGAAVYVVAMQDRSAQVRSERALEAAAAELRATLESTADGILVVDLAGRIRNFNRRFASLWAVPDDLLERHDDDGVLEWMRRSVTEPAEYMWRLALIDESALVHATDVFTLRSGKVLERVAVPQLSGGRAIGRVFSFRDLTDAFETRQRIERLTETDALTGLPNRKVLGERIGFALAMAQRDGTPFALLFLNLDRFKHINETLGRAGGDQVLQGVAERLGGCLRQVDTVARLGGDEFAVLVHQGDRGGAESAARRLLEAMQRPFIQAGMSFTLTASVGVALCPQDGGSADALLRHAEAAMREVKATGRAGFRLHRHRPDEADAKARSRMQLDHAMRQALAQGRFRLHYQPQVDMAAGQVLGAEALLRWRDPERGVISPGEFIPVAEESGFIVPIGDWVLCQAVRQAATWQAQGRELVVSVNVSALQFQQPGFVEGVAAVLRAAGLPPALLELELTESILIQDAPDALARLQALAALGVKLAIDDFGTGYSSLGYLKHFPVSRLKIDRSFVSGLPGEASDAGIARAIIQLGQALDLQVVAEGVETEAQRRFLEQAGCDLFQGFLYAPALNVPDFEARVDREGQPVSAGGRVVPLRKA